MSTAEDAEVNVKKIRNPQSKIGNLFIVAARSGKSNARRVRLVLCSRTERRGQGIAEKSQGAIAVTCHLSPSPLRPMTIEERVNADFRGTGLTIGRHPMAYRREELNKLGVKRAIDLREIRNGVWVRVAGWIIVRQRPGTAKGFLFLSMEDETGIANVIVTPDIFDRNRVVLVNQPLLLIEGPLQNQDNVIHVRARRIQPLSYAMAAAASHDFH